MHNSGKIIFVEGDGDSVGGTMGFALLILLIRSWGSTRWHGKVRATSESLFLKFHGNDGRNRAYEFKIIRPNLYAREIEGDE